MKKIIIIILVCLTVLSMFSCKEKVNYTIYYQKGIDLYMEKNLEDAIPYFQRTIKLNKKYKQSYYMLAKCYYYQNELDKAITKLNNILKKNPEYIDANLLMAKVYYQKGEWNQSKEFIMKVLYSDSNNLEARLILGDIMKNYSLTDKALINYSSVITNLDNLAIAYLNRAKIYYESNLFNKAINELSFINDNSTRLSKSIIEKSKELLIQINLHKTNN